MQELQSRKAIRFGIGPPPLSLDSFRVLQSTLFFWHLVQIVTFELCQLNTFTYSLHIKKNTDIFPSPCPLACIIKRYRQKLVLLKV